MTEVSITPEKNRGPLIALCSFTETQQEILQEKYDRSFTKPTERAHVLEGILVTSPEDETLFNKVSTAIRLATTQVTHDPNNKSLMTTVFDGRDKDIEGYNPHLSMLPLITAEFIPDDPNPFPKTIVLLIPHNAGETHYLKVRDKVIETANEILTTFGTATQIPDSNGFGRFPTFEKK